MLEELNSIKKDIIRILISKPLDNWNKAELIFTFPPYGNKGYSGSQYFYDSQGNKINTKVIFLDIEAENNLFNFIIKFNKGSKYNEIIFYTKRDDYDNSTIEILFNQEIDDDFRNNIPKSQRKKAFLPWYLNEKYNHLKS